jgi:hypothetical protein
MRWGEAMALLDITILFGLSLLAAWILIEVLTFDALHRK